MGIDLFAIFVPQPLKELPRPYLTRKNRYTGYIRYMFRYQYWRYV